MRAPSSVVLAALDCAGSTMEHSVAITSSIRSAATLARGSMMATMPIIRKLMTIIIE